jgi:DNA-binding response OmpR family regulator
METEDPYQLLRINSFIEVIEDDENISVDKAKDLETAKRLAGEDTITAVIIFIGNPIRIQVYEGTDKIKNRTVEAILNSYTQHHRP